MSTLWSGRTKDGVEVHLDTLHVSRTYAGLFIGTPHSRLNKRIVERAVENATSLVYSRPVVLVPPVRTSHQTSTSFPSDQGDRTYEELPQYLCTGSFTSHVTRDPLAHGASLTLVWFQAESPLLHGIQPSLETIEWWSSAEEFCY